MSRGSQGVLVAGGGRMAAAYSSQLEKHMIPVLTRLGEDVRDVLISFFSGKETLAFLEQAGLAAGTRVVDLTTQTVLDASRCDEYLRATGCFYFAGGVTGGMRQVGTRDMVLLLGARDGTERIPKYLAFLGRPVRMDSLEQAVAAKLLHNLVLVVHNHVLGAALSLADGVGLRGFERVLDAGTAGRRPSASSVARDHLREPLSSYSGALVAKDLDAILSTFPALDKLIGIDIRELAETYDMTAGHPYTTLARLPFRMRK